MRKNLVKSIGISIVAMLILSIIPVIPILPVLASPTARIYLDPSSYTFTSPPDGESTLFNVTVRVEDVANLSVYQITVNYNDTVINATRWFEPKTHPEYVFWARTTLPVPAPPPVSYTHTDPDQGQATVGASLFPAPPSQSPFTGSGIICIIEFHIEMTPGKLETLTSALHINKPETFMLDQDGVEIPCTKEDGSYQITWQEPPAPDLAIRPDYLEFGPWPPEVNCTTDFWVGAYVENLEAAWGLVNAGFTLGYDSSLINATGYSLGPGATGVANIATPGVVLANLSWASAPSGDVLMLNVTFHIIYQDTVPPRALWDYNETDITWDDYTLIDPPDPGVIPIANAYPGTVRIYALMALPMPWLEVDPSYVEKGPEPCLGEIFSVNIEIKNMLASARMIAFQFKLKYDGHLLSNVSVIEGAFLSDPRWNLYGTLFFGFFDDYPFTHVVVGGILFPNPGTGEWDQTQFPQAPGPDVEDLDPPVDTTLATISFDVKKQVYPEIKTCELGIYDFDSPGEAHFMDVDGQYIATNITAFVNGTYKIRADYMPGREIDVYTQYPDGQNGKGPNNPSDMFCPQKLVILYAKVTYNYWPVQQKIVGFEIEDHTGYIWAKLTAVTNEEGIASVEFRMPWPCDDPESLFGVWTVTATVDIACTVIIDTLTFHFDYCTKVHSVDVDGGVQDEGKWFKHCQWVKLTVQIKSHMQRWQRVLIVVVIKDELGVPIGIAKWYGWIGGATYCRYTYVTRTLWIHIPKFAFAGQASIHVNLFDKDPTDGGKAYCPEFESPPEIWIQPY